MKKLWNMISVIAIVNLFAVLGVGGWMWKSGRLDGGRVRMLLQVPPEQPAPVPEVPIEEPAGDLTPTTVKIDASDRALQQHALSLRRLQDEKVQLDRELEERQALLAQKTLGFQAEKRAWDESMAGSKASKSAEQFKKSVKLLESVPAKQGKEWILEMVRSGSVDEAVDYLDAMSPFKASSLLKAFKGEDETKVATDLLHRIRRRTPDAPAIPESALVSDAPSNGSSTSTAPPVRAPNAAEAAAARQPVPAPTGAESPAQPAQKPAAAPATVDKPTANQGAAIDPPGGADAPRADGTRR
ncbi:MAG: hypothetical protein SGJ11_17010 [Phycisphaerae bacterium]|nr:hypothetical protein [Phycisphaerae bacterium]